MNPLVSLIIVNYNGKSLTIDCLTSLQKQSFDNFEVVVVDNASTDNSLREINRYLKDIQFRFPVKLITLNENKGFSGGNIEGLRCCTGKYICLLNNDTEPDSKWLERLVQVMDSKPEVGICGSKLIVFGTDKIDSAGDGFSTSFKGFKRGEGKLASSYNESGLCFGACAGAALYRMSMIESIGFLDEDFFLIHEDTDLNLRAQLMGWKIMFVADAVVYHKVRSSIGNMSKTAIYYTIRNSEFVRIKNIPISLFLSHFPEFIIGFVSELVFFAIKNKKPILYTKAKVDALKMFPMMLRKRKKILTNRKVSDRYLMGIMTSVWNKEFIQSKVGKMLNHVG